MARPTHAVWLARARARSEGNPNERWKVRAYCEKHGLVPPWWASTNPATRATPPPPVALDPRLSAWQRATWGRGVRVHREGVSLLDFEHGWRHFGSVDEALAALG